VIATKVLQQLKRASDDQNMGINIVRCSLQSPVR
jgi:hypothetical protein